MMDVRIPSITRANMSRPSWSVPNQWSADGPCCFAPALESMVLASKRAIGPYCAANKGNEEHDHEHSDAPDGEPVSNKAPVCVRPQTTVLRNDGLIRRNHRDLLLNSRHQRYLILGSTAAYRRSMTRFAMQTRNARKMRRAHDHAIVAPGDGIDGLAPQARYREHRLDDERAADEHDERPGREPSARGSSSSSAHGQ